MITRRQFSKFGLGLTAFLKAISASGIAPRDNSRPPKNEVRPEKGVHIVVDVPQKCLAGHAITITMKLQNDSDHQIAYGSLRGYEYKDYSVEVKDSAGSIVSRTRFGQRILREDMLEGIASTIFHEIPPGGSQNRSLNIARIFDLTVAGKYTILLEHRGGKASTEAILVVQEP